MVQRTGHLIDHHSGNGGRGTLPKFQVSGICRGGEGILAAGIDSHIISTISITIAITLFIIIIIIINILSMI